MLKKTDTAYLAVGCDSNPDDLKRSLGSERVFSLADCMACIYMLAFRRAES